MCIFVNVIIVYYCDIGRVRVRVDISMMLCVVQCYSNSIIEHDRRKPVLSVAPLDRRYDKHGIER